MSHHHSREDGFPNIEDVSKQNEDDQASNSSIIHHSASLGRRAKAGRAIFSDKVCRLDGYLTSLPSDSAPKYRISAT